MTRTVLIVGAGLAGSRCAETLRAGGFTGRIVLVGAERTPPYERPALSKSFLSGARADVQLRPPGHWHDRGIELELGTRIVELGDNTATTASGAVHRWDALVLATGLRARRLPGRTHVLRTLDDAIRLRRELRPGKRVTIVGSGFVGAEVASTALSLGVPVRMFELAAVPFEATLGKEVGQLLADRYLDHGVDLRLATSATDLDRDVVLAAVGAEPADELLPGVATDAFGRTAIPNVYACGDVAVSWRPSLGRYLRIEHWTNAAGQGAAVARAILGDPTPFDDLPYVWSDQFGLRLQLVGRPEPGDRVEIEGGPESFSARYLKPGGQLRAALLANRPAEAAALRRELPLAA
jgi:3-phenylpropionate/trans-cinnamate dioxygenase ferredoxin reductase subunit